MIRIYCIKNGRVYKKNFEDRLEALNYANSRQSKGFLCFISG